MQQLDKTEWRCSGRYAFDQIGTCLERETCMRYLALIKYDRINNLENYQGMTVLMARRDCKDKIEVKNERTVHKRQHCK